jgi:hypothetical protein
MRANKPGGTRTDEIWDGILEEGPKPDPKIKAVKHAVERELRQFEQHKEIVFDHLRAGSKSRPFDKEKAWCRLTRLAQAYFWRQGATPAPKRVARLRRLADALGRARYMAEIARRDHVGSDLFAAWFDGSARDPRGQIVPDADGTLRVVYFPELDLKETVATLDALKAAVLCAANDVPGTAPGRAAILPRPYIGALADAYKELTGSKPGAGVGPFARFVMQFRAALDPSYRTKDKSGPERVDEGMLAAIKDALRSRRRTQGYSSK